MHMPFLGERQSSSSKEKSHLARNATVLFTGSGGYSETASPQQTWTAGMTKGVPPKELIAQLKRNRSAPDPEEEGGVGAGGVAPGSHPLDVLYGNKGKADEVARSSSGLPGKDSLGLKSKSSGPDFDTFSSAQVGPCSCLLRK